MRLTATEDVTAPADAFFAQVSDFAALADRARSLGAIVTARQEGPAVAGMAWDIAFQFRGRDRAVVATLTRFDAPDGYTVETVMEGLIAETQVTVASLDAHRSQLEVICELSAKSLTARLLLQSLKLGRGRIAARFQARISEYAQLAAGRAQTSA
ncbi:MAG: SRPBCC family protein [Pseudomonadota bacterium]